MSLFYKLKPVFDDGTMLWFFCPAHSDKNRPNLSLTYDGKYRGRWKCWACGYSGRVGVRMLKEILKGYNMGRRKQICTAVRTDVDWFNMWLLSRDNSVSNGVISQILGFVNPSCGSLASVVDKLNAGWDGKSLLFPLRGANMNVVGVHKRPEKTNLRGSCIGIYAPPAFNLFPIDNTKPLFICEGVTDLICLLMMGFNALGRFSAATCNKIIKDVIANTSVTRVIIIPDNDEIGKKGAEKLKKDLQEVVACDIMYVDEQWKDVKEMYNAEGYKKTKEWIEQASRLL